MVVRIGLFVLHRTWARRDTVPRMSRSERRLWKAAGPGASSARGQRPERGATARCACAAVDTATRRETHEKKTAALVGLSSLPVAARQGSGSPPQLGTPRRAPLPSRLPSGKPAPRRAAPLPFPFRLGSSPISSSLPQFPPEIRIARLPSPRPAPPMPSKRPSAHAMDEAAASASAGRLLPSTPRSKKRSSRSKSRARSRDRRRSPNPNPSSRRERAPEPGSAAPAPSRKSDRRPKPRYIPDSATLATAIVSSAAAAAAAASGGGGRGSAGAISKLWSEADEVALLTGAAAFKDRTGIAPRLPDMPDLFEAIRDSLAPHLDQAKMYYKLKRLKSKYQHSVPGDSSTAHEHRVRDLCAALWGAELARPAENDVVEAEEAEEEDAGGDREGAVRLPMVKEVLGEYWKSNGQGLSRVSLEKGLALLGSQEASVAEGKWRRQLEADMRMQMRRHDLGKEVYGLLIDAIKGLGP
ncbi:hypothetical protein C2845_PM09G05430 [Panicum miliaceum]|uniref:Glabrous enhancer-binding protein-like DBD domain-containing protein n=1 Tax=Panicum miliaceum TaxID=4540 RepID=A0A3L6S1X3_PANMI|nr:hypothetical protein C2845_PM09G05430 [Panicum miliaceum]